MIVCCHKSDGWLARLHNRLFAQPPEPNRCMRWTHRVQEMFHLEGLVTGRKSRIGLLNVATSIVITHAQFSVGSNEQPPTITPNFCWYTEQLLTGHWIRRIILLNVEVCDQAFVIGLLYLIHSLFKQKKFLLPLFFPGISWTTCVTGMVGPDWPKYTESKCSTSTQSLTTTEPFQGQRVFMMPFKWCFPWNYRRVWPSWKTGCCGLHTNKTIKSHHRIILYYNSSYICLFEEVLSCWDVSVQPGIFEMENIKERPCRGKKKFL